MKNFLFLLFLNLSIPTFACRCNEPPSIEKAYLATPVVVSAKVISLQYVSLWSTMTTTKRAAAKEAFLKSQPHTKSLETPIIQKVELEVIKNYKGENITDTIIIFTPRNGASCGFTWFELGEYFIIYASPQSFIYDFFNPNKLKNLEQKNTYWTNQCSRTTNYYEKEGNKLDLLSQE